LECKLLVPIIVKTKKSPDLIRDVYDADIKNGWDTKIYLTMTDTENSYEMLDVPAPACAGLSGRL